MLIAKLLENAGEDGHRAPGRTSVLELARITSITKAFASQVSSLLATLDMSHGLISAPQIEIITATEVQLQCR